MAKNCAKLMVSAVFLCGLGCINEVAAMEIKSVSMGAGPLRGVYEQDVMPALHKQVKQYIAIKKEPATPGREVRLVQALADIDGTLNNVRHIINAEKKAGQPGLVGQFEAMLAFAFKVSNEDQTAMYVSALREHFVHAHN